MVEGKLFRIVAVNFINSYLEISEDNDTANSAASPEVSKPNSSQPEAELNFLQNNATLHSLKMLIIILCLINFL